MSSALSTAVTPFLCLLLGGCSVHLGVPPASGPWLLAPVASLSVEPGISEGLRAAVADGLSARGALADPAAAGEVLGVQVESTAWVPARREAPGAGGEAATVAYEARLTVLFTAGERSRRFSRTAMGSGYADGAAAERDRPRLFQGLSREVAALGVAWVLSGPVLSEAEPSGPAPSGEGAAG